MEDLFREFWWLIFPIFGMAMAVLELVEDERRAARTVALSRRRLEGK